jgi:CRP/FNR family transcriptional regulator, dissimilatory nitrate respiration regulator
MSNKRALLSRSILFSSLPLSVLDKISSFCLVKTFAKDDTIFDEGDKAYGFFIVAQGKVKVYKLSSSGDEHIIHLIREGGSIAEAVVFSNMNRYPAYAQALEDSTLIFIPGKEFLSAIKSDFSLTLSVLSSLSEKLKYFNSLVEELSLKEADARLAKYFLDISLKKKSDSFVLDDKKIELARRLGIAPETLSRLFKKFTSNRVIRITKNNIQLFDKTRLARLASGEKI